MVKQPEEFYSKGAEKFAENQALENLPQEYLELLDEFMERVGAGKVLDAGCGPGRDTHYFTENGLNAVGIDLAEGMIEHAKQNKKGIFHLMDIKELEFDDSTLDGVWCNTVIQFFPVEEMSEVISELDRVLKPDGLMYISFKAGEGSIIREKYGDGVKQHLIPEEKAEELLKTQGYRIINRNRSEVNGVDILSILCKKHG